MLSMILVPKKHWNSLTEQKNYKMRTIKKKEKHLLKGKTLTKRRKNTY